MATSQVREWRGIGDEGLAGKGFSRCRAVAQRSSKVHSGKSSLLGEDSGTHCARVEVGNEVDKWAGVR